MPFHKYQRDGYLFPVQVLSATEAADALHECEQLTASALRIASPHSSLPWAWKIASHRRLLDAVETLIGPDILLWGTLIFSKPPESDAIISWHQDSSYAGFLNAAPSLTAWIALTDATPENGCMRVIPGSHGAQLPFTTEQEPGDMSIRGQRVLTEVDVNRAVNIELKPGHASLHDTKLIHGSARNRSRGPRTGFIARYTTPAIEQPPYPVHCMRGNPGRIQCVS